MKFLLSIVTIFSFIGLGQTDLCQYNFSISDIDRNVIIEIIGFFNGFTPGPYKAIVENNVQFWLFNRSSVSGNQLNYYAPTVPTKKTIFLIHGWLCNRTNDLMPELKDAYLTRYDANVIIVDWSYYSGGTYGDTFRYIPNIGASIAKFMMKLHTTQNITIDSMHVVGHSMGGQTSGFVGQSLINTYNQTLYRITALDPAGPIYSTKSFRERLDESDATYVDVIHTNAGILGYANRCGDVDYYPNCGISQSGCNFQPTGLSVIDFVLKKVSCDHLRSVDYMIESINQNNFKAKRSINQVACYGINSDISYMGEDSIAQYTKSKYILYTNPTKPFAQG